ncbi:MAG TPA: MarR family transcriptional regulator [Thermoanaerobaculia bacterium]|nr:MarR family transcriptional regulator [Thermoanaerobaculia bacterium]
MGRTTGPVHAREASLGEALDFMKLLWRLDHALQTTSRRMAESVGVTGPQRLALRVVGRFPGITPGETAAVLRLHPSTVTVIVKGLERAGLVERSEDPADRRRTRLCATAAGRKVASATGGTVEEAVRRTLARVPAADLETAARVLSALASELEPTAAGRGSRAGRRRA